MQAASAEETRQALYAPLLGDEACCSQEYNHHQHHDHDDDDVADTMMMMMDDDDDIITSLCCNDTVIIWVILPCLLLSQFGMAFLLHDENTAHLSWPICNFSIFLFCITAWLFRHACADSKMKTPVLWLLAPEISMDIVLALVLFNQVELGFITLLASMLVLSGFVVVTTAHHLFCRRRESRNNSHDDHEQEEVQEEEKIAIAQVFIV